MQTAVQILDSLNDVLHFILVLGLNLAGLTNGNVDSELDSSSGGGQPTGGGICLRCEADFVLARIGSREVEPARVAVPLRHNAVVIVEGLINGDLHLDAVIDRIGAGLRVDNFGLIATCLLFNHHN